MDSIDRGDGVLSRERILHERVAQKESHEVQMRGIVGWFYRTYISATHSFLARHPGARVLEVGCGEGVLLRASGFAPVQLDISMTRLYRAQAAGNPLICADGMDLPFADASFDVVLLIAVLEHVSRPERIVDEAWRVLKPGGEAAILTPNDVWMSMGRLILLKWPPRYPDHLSWIPPQRIRRMAGWRFSVEEAFALPVKWLPFGLNMYYWVTVRKR
jgi:SAM-dependent methyltransferase